MVLLAKARAKIRAKAVGIHILVVLREAKIPDVPRKMQRVQSLIPSAPCKKSVCSYAGLKFWELAMPEHRATTNTTRKKSKPNG